MAHIPLEALLSHGKYGRHRGRGGAAYDRVMTERDPLQPELVRSAFHGIPSDARRMGFDRNTEQGALLALTGSLDPHKPGHRAVAWLMLVAVVGPGLFVLLSTLLGRA